MKEVLFLPCLLRAASTALACAALVTAAAAQASYAFYVGRDLTEDGSVLVGGTGEEVSSHWLEIVPAGSHPAGATIKVNFVEDAALGTEATVPTLKGRAKLQIDSGIQSGRVLRMRGRGLPEVGGGRRGDRQTADDPGRSPCRSGGERSGLIGRQAALDRRQDKARPGIGKKIAFGQQ